MQSEKSLLGEVSPTGCTDVTMTTLVMLLEVGGVSDASVSWVNRVSDLFTSVTRAERQEAGRFDAL